MCSFGLFAQKSLILSLTDKDVDNDDNDGGSVAEQLESWT